MWVDADGRVIGPAGAVTLHAPVGAIGYQPAYFDSNGHIWRLDTEAASYHPLGYERAVYYAQAGCTGEAYVQVMLGSPGASEVFRMYGDPTLRVRSINLRASSAMVASQLGSEGSCHDQRETLDAAIPLAQTVVVQTPTVTFTPPLRRILVR